MKHVHGFRRNDGTWMPEHVRLAIERLLLEHVDRLSSDTHRRVAGAIKSAHPSLPMSERELVLAVQRLACGTTVMSRDD